MPQTLALPGVDHRGLRGHVKMLKFHPKSNGKALKKFKQGNGMMRCAFWKDPSSFRRESGLERGKQASRDTGQEDLKSPGEQQ